MDAPGTASAPGVPGAALCVGRYVWGYREWPRGPRRLCSELRPALEPIPGHAYRLSSGTDHSSVTPRHGAAGVVGPFELPADLTDRYPHSDRPTRVLSSS